MRARRPLDDESGFTLIELTLVVAVIAVVLAFALVGFGVFRSSAQQRSAQAGLRDTLLLERAWHVENAAFTSLVADLRSLDPQWIPFGLPNEADRPLVFVNPLSAGQQVCLTALDADGTWWSVFEDAAAGTWYGQGLPFPCDSSLTATYVRGGWD